LSEHFGTPKRYIELKQLQNVQLQLWSPKVLQKLKYVTAVTWSCFFFDETGGVAPY
jgi:hypothetical protein